LISRRQATHHFSAGPPQALELCLQPQLAPECPPGGSGDNIDSDIVRDIFYKFCIWNFLHAKGEQGAF
jgi:hypothetical protein